MSYCSWCFLFLIFIFESSNRRVVVYSSRQVFVSSSRQVFTYSFFLRLLNNSTLWFLLFQYQLFSTYIYMYYPFVFLFIVFIGFCRKKGESRRKEKASWLLIARPACTIAWTAVACNRCLLGLPVALASASLSGFISRFFRVYRSSTSSIGFCFFQITKGWSTSSSISHRDDFSRFFVWSSLLVLSTSFPSSSFRFSLLQSSCHSFPFTVFLCVLFLLIVFTIIALFYASLSPVCSLFFFALVHLYVARIINIRYHRYLQIFVFVFSTPSSITSFLFKNDITFLVFLVFYTQNKMYQRAEFSSLLLPLFLRLFF